MSELEPQVWADEYRALNSETIPLAEQVTGYWGTTLRQLGGQALKDLPIIFSVSGPSLGAGKSSAVDELVDWYTSANFKVYKPKSATTRRVRSEADFGQYNMLRYPEGFNGPMLTADDAAERFTELAKGGIIKEAAPLPDTATGETIWRGKMFDWGRAQESDFTIIEIGLDGLPTLKYGAECKLPDGSTMKSEPVPGLISFAVTVPGRDREEMLDELKRRAELRGDDPQMISGRLDGPDAPVPQEVDQLLAGEIPYDHLIFNHDRSQYEGYYRAANGIMAIVSLYNQAKSNLWLPAMALEHQAAREAAAAAV